MPSITVNAYVSATFLLSVTTTVFFPVASQTSATGSAAVTVASTTAPFSDTTAVVAGFGLKRPACTVGALTPLGLTAHWTAPEANVLPLVPIVTVVAPQADVLVPAMATSMATPPSKTSPLFMRDSFVLTGWRGRDSLLAFQSPS